MAYVVIFLFFCCLNRRIEKNTNENLKHHPMKLHTNRLIIRPVKPEDKNGIFAYRSDKATNRYQGWIPDSIGDVEAFIDQVAKQVNQPGTWFQFVVVEKSSNIVAGDIGVHFIDDDGTQVEIGCTLHRDFQHRGYAAEALNRVIAYLFTELEKHRIIASIDPENKNAIRLVEGLGFRQEAHFVESLRINGKWVDDLVYAMLEKDWERMHK